MDAAAASPDAPEEDARAAAAAAPVPTASRVRGIYAREDEAAPYLMNGIPTFETKAACEKWVREHCASKDPPSNPDRPHMTQMLTTLCTWPQVEAYVLGARDAYLARYPPRPAPSSNAVAENLWVLDASAKSADAELRSRLSLPCHRLLSSDSTLATLSYLFDHMRSGIYVLIRRNHVCVFAPFVNQDYENAWGPRLELDENQTVEQYYKRKRKLVKGRREHVLGEARNDKREWWANGNIICNEHSREGRPKEESQLWGDRFVAPLRAMLDAVCEERDVGDCEFFVNKRDYPHLKFNEQHDEAVEPYGFLIDKDDRNPDDDVALPRTYRGAALAPIFSFYCSARFADLPLPPSEDWEAADGRVFPPSFAHELRDDGRVELDATPRDLFTQAQFAKFDAAWGDKAETAFFRGTATGGGVAPETNQRLALAALHARWTEAGAPRTGRDRRDRRDGSGEVKLLDAKLTGSEPGRVVKPRGAFQRCGFFARSVGQACP